MWRGARKLSSLRKLKISSNTSSSLPVFRPTELSQGLFFPDNMRQLKTSRHINQQIGGSECQIDIVGVIDSVSSQTPYKIPGFFNRPRCYGNVAEAIVSTSSEEDEEIRELVEQINKDVEKESEVLRPKEPRTVAGMGLWKYNMLRRRQVKMETEAWEQAAKEYQELLEDMCEQKLAPNLPYIKSLFLGWFEPLRDAIQVEHDLCEQGKNRGAYAPYINHLPADKMAVITMHKLMGILMTGGGNGSCRVIQGALQIGDAIEHEIFR